MPNGESTTSPDPSRPVVSVITDDELARVKDGDLSTLVSLDDRGLLIGPDESRGQFAERLEALRGNIGELQAELAKHSQVNLYDFMLEAAEQLPAPVFEPALDVTESLYRFRIDWIQGFFSNHKMGLLFAGCAMYSYDDFFAVFIIRKAFQHNDKWLIYSRTELIAHELCHIAHIGFRNPNYEELFAYQTAESMFRRGIGGVLRSSTDTYLILGSVFLLMIVQIANVAVWGPSGPGRFLVPTMFAVVFSIIAFIGGRYFMYFSRYDQARINVSAVAGPDNAVPILFRCSEEEIRTISRLDDPDTLRDWMIARASDDVRWDIICEKFVRGKSS